MFGIVEMGDQERASVLGDRYKEAVQIFAPHSIDACLLSLFGCYSDSHMPAHKL